MIKKILFVITPILLVIIQVSFLNSFSFLRNYLNITLIAIVLVTVYAGYRWGLLWAAVAGIIFDTYSSGGFGITTWSLLVPVMLIYNLFRKLLASKSIYSLELAVLTATAVFLFLQWALGNIYYWLNWSGSPFLLTSLYFRSAVGQLFVHVVILAALYLLIKLVGGKIKARFFISDRAT